MSHGDDPTVNPWIPAGKLPVRRTSAGAGRMTRYSPAKPAAASFNQIRGAWYASDRQRVDSLPAHRRLPIWDGPVHAHLGGRPVDGNGSGWWWLGVHGGTGVSTLERFLPGGADAQRWWPDPAFGGPSAVFLVCRAHLAGLDRARDAATQWAAADVPAGLLLAGVVVVADAPGRQTRVQSEAQRLLAAVVPRLWTVPWIDDLRSAADGDPLPLPPALLGLRTDLAALRSSAAAR